MDYGTVILLTTASNGTGWNDFSEFITVSQAGENGLIDMARPG